ncbi:MAG: hypothetical protein M0R22_00555 [Dehalococcoidia bacterium]|nr:hypothetical protein [Dehalococcoidia bacterium]
MAVEAAEAWGADLPHEVQDIPVAELEAAGARCEELATIALRHVTRGDLVAATNRLADAAQIEVLDCGRRGMYTRLHAAVQRAAAPIMEVTHAQEA